MQHSVIIIGAGLSGLTLAQGLRKNNIPFRLYEQDAALEARSQGYRVRVSGDGIRAFEACLSPEHFKRLKASCAASTATSNKPQAAFSVITGQKMGGLQGDVKALEQSDLPPWSVDRAVARAILADGIDVQFGKSLSSYEIDNGVVVTFTDGSSSRGTLLVGADGTWSKVRKQLLPGYNLLDTGGRLTYGRTSVDVAHLPARAMQGLTSLLGEQVKGILEPMHFGTSTADYIYWALFTRENNADVRHLVAGWKSEFRELIELADHTSHYRVLSAAPAIADWTSDRVTLVGDAIHTMAPTSALGATTAVRDAALLTKCLVENQLATYGVTMRRYARPIIESTKLGGKMMFDMGAFDDMDVVPTNSGHRGSNAARSG